MQAGQEWRRNTSTHVEKTEKIIGGLKHAWKHLHARGENTYVYAPFCMSEETPPRTWRKPLPFLRPSACLRNTSTHVEKTFRSRCRNDRERKHLHARGENLVLVEILLIVEETPPRTWRKPAPCVSTDRRRGNTSTHVEKTHFHAVGVSSCEKHLHARGENQLRWRRERLIEETPPRTWRKLRKLRTNRGLSRNTSTHVEKTPVAPRVRW